MQEDCSWLFTLFYFIRLFSFTKKSYKIRFSVSVGFDHKNSLFWSFKEELYYEWNYQSWGFVFVSDGKGKAGIPDIWMPLSEEDKDSQIYCLGSKCKVSQCRRWFQFLESSCASDERWQRRDLYDRDWRTEERWSI